MSPSSTEEKKMRKGMYDLVTGEDGFNVDVGRRLFEASSGQALSNKNLISPRKPQGKSIVESQTQRTDTKSSNQMGPRLIKQPSVERITPGPSSISSNPNRARKSNEIAITPE